MDLRSLLIGADAEYGGAHTTSSGVLNNAQYGSDDPASYSDHLGLYVRGVCCSRCVTESEHNHHSKKHSRP